ncbi:flavodoxin FldB [Agaribacter marinus]|uniref:Flavodoxin n=1 Tax=Agaribacter marinus TaxID=1431249 RepID=A0AA37T5F6_9ALTE|nr:flavodoxin FldB [Agaribacter marinus]GLR72473.1 flavodoxin [Agaribacter marinus]
MQIAIFYGSTTCYTEMAGEKIQGALEALTRQRIPMFNIKDISLHKCQEYELIVFGISTWDFGELQEDWESTWEDIRSLKLAGKTVAIYGLGDQYGYADWFQDALGMLHDEVVAVDADIIGYWPNEGYEFTASKALTEDKDFFVGLSLDDENQFEMSDERIKNWCAQLIEELQ